MLNPEQIEIADFLLQHLLANNGMATKDSYPPALEKRGFSKLVTTPVIEYLTDRGLVTFIEPDKYWLKLLPEGYAAAKIGLAKYLGNEESDKELDRKQKTETTRTAISTRTMSKLGIVLTFIVPVLLMVAQNYYQKSNEKPQKANTNRSQSHQATDTIVSHLRVDSAFIKVIKDSLKHDQEFLNEIKILIEK